MRQKGPGGDGEQDCMAVRTGFAKESVEEKRETKFQSFNEMPIYKLKCCLRKLMKP